LVKVAYIVVVGHEPDLERKEGAASTLRALGARVRTLPLWDDPARVAPDADEGVRAIVIEALDRPDLAALVLRSVRREPALSEAGCLVAVSAGQVSQLDPAGGFDDFVLAPYVPAELYARVRAVEWRRSEFANEERIKLGRMVIDRLGHEVTLDGALVPLTARELALLAYLCDHRGRVVSRREALAHVWGGRYEGGPRTVDIHVRRLRAKLGDALPLHTLRGVGYKVAAPAPPREDDGARLAVLAGGG
jgi:DNA-binding response OmpR family regulator